MVFYAEYEFMFNSFPFCLARQSFSGWAGRFCASKELRPQGKKRQVWSRGGKAKRHLVFLPGTVTLHEKTVPCRGSNSGIKGNGFRFSVLIFISFKNSHYLCKKSDMDKKPTNRIKVMLADRKKTNLWLATELGVNPSTVSKW